VRFNEEAMLEVLLRWEEYGCSDYLEHKAVIKELIEAAQKPDGDNSIQYWWIVPEDPNAWLNDDVFPEIPPWLSSGWRIEYHSRIDYSGRWVLSRSLDNGEALERFLHPGDRVIVRNGKVILERGYAVRNSLREDS
jgi:hypothetical protein